jgi:hypothetical protein
VSLTSYEDHLKKTQPDWESRWENVQELINFASEVQLDINDTFGISPFKDPVEMDIKVLGVSNVDETPIANLETKYVPAHMFSEMQLTSGGSQSCASQTISPRFDAVIRR